MNADRLDETTPLTDAERLELGIALKETTATQGWAIVDRLLTRLVNAAALTALDDDDPRRPPTYYKGKVAAIGELRALLDGAVVAAEEQMAGSRKAAARDIVSTILKPGGGMF